MDNVIYRGNNICDNILPTDMLSEAEDYFRNYDVEDEQIDSNDPAPNNENAENICECCYLRKRNTVFIPCGHVYCCMVCSERWTNTNVSSFDLYSLLDEEDRETLVFGEPLQKPRCPICRADINSTVRLNFV